MDAYKIPCLRFKIAASSPTENQHSLRYPSFGSTIAAMAGPMKASAEYCGRFRKALQHDDSETKIVLLHSM